MVRELVLRNAAAALCVHNGLLQRASATLRVESGFAAMGGGVCVDSGNNLKGAVYDGMHRLVATCLWIYICEYAASLLEAYVFVVILDACTLGRQHVFC